MKGAIDYLGSDKFDILLVNDEHTGKRERADVFIERSGMQADPRVHSDTKWHRRKVFAETGQLSWGYTVIGPDGNLVGVNLYAHQLYPALEKAIGADTGDDESGFKLTAKVKSSVKFGFARKLKEDRKTVLTVKLDLPDGFHVYGPGAKNPAPTALKIAYAPGLKIGEPVFPEGKPGHDGAVRLEGPVTIKVPVTLPKGMPIGHHVVHGTLQFMACNAERCLPVQTRTWMADFKVM